MVSDSDDSERRKDDDSAWICNNGFVPLWNKTIIQRIQYTQCVLNVTEIMLDVWN